MHKIKIDTSTLEGYNLFLKCKGLTRYKIENETIHTDDISYNNVFGGGIASRIKYNGNDGDFDYQTYYINKALEKEAYAIMWDCGLGKTLAELRWAHEIVKSKKGKVLILCPLQVMEDMQLECERLYGYRMDNLRKQEWTNPIALMNYEAMKEIDMRGVDGICLDESSILKNGDGAIRKYLQEMAGNIKYRLAASATPAPNNQAEYATLAVWLGYATTIKEYYSKYFQKDGTSWFMKPHAKNAFYENLSSWACYLNDPESLGFQRGACLNYEPNYIVQNTFCDQKYMPDGSFLAQNINLKDQSKIFTKLRSDPTQDRFKFGVKAIEDKRAIIWCYRNAEENMYKKHFGCKVINGSTPIEKRVEIINEFRTGIIDKIITKPKVMGFGVNVPEAETHLFSGFNFSFEKFYQAVRRSHRYGRKGILDVVVPVSEPEYPIWENLNNKLKTYKNDVVELQKRFVRQCKNYAFK